MPGGVWWPACLVTLSLWPLASPRSLRPAPQEQLHWAWVTVLRAAVGSEGQPVPLGR